MKPLVLLLVLLSMTVKSWSNQIDVKNLNLSYETDRGIGSFDQFVFDQYNYPNFKQFNLNYNGSEVIFEIDNEEVIIPDEKGALKDFQSFDVENLTIQSNQSTIQGHLPKMRGSSTDSDINIQTVKLQCKSTPRPPLENDLFFFLEDCLTTSNLNIKNIYIANKNKNEFISLLENTLEIEASKNTQIQNLALDIKNHNYNISLSINTGMRVTLKISGTIEYLANEKAIRLSITKAKAGIFNIKEKIFEEAEKKESEKLRVERPNIFFYFE